MLCRTEQVLLVQVVEGFLYKVVADFQFEDSSIQRHQFSTLVSRGSESVLSRQQVPRKEGPLTGTILPVKTDEGNGSRIGLIVGLSIGLPLFTCIFVVAIFVIRKKRMAIRRGLSSPSMYSPQLDLSEPLNK